MDSNQVMITKGFNSLLSAMAPYIARELERAYGDDWWGKAVYGKLYEDQRRNLPESGEWGELVDSLDIRLCLLLFDLHWNEVFRKRLSVDHRTWAKELMGTRNSWAHAGVQDPSDDDTWRALDTMSRLCEQIDPESAEEIRSLQREVRYGSADGSTAVKNSQAVATQPVRSGTDGILVESPSEGLPSWRDVMVPHPDVAQGRYRKAEFAADLSQVARGEATPEYQDPVEFFGRTYVTEGMAGLLVQALKRISSQDGEPVIQLKTAFGGGKTHSMLALYHLLRGQTSLEKIPAVKPVMNQAGLSSIPKANVAVLVGTAIDPSVRNRPANYPGITINTMWGEMAAQLAAGADNLKLYDLVKEADRKGVSPGSATLKKLFDECGPCLVLMDELVAYAKKLYGVDNLPAGSYDNFITFIQEITEAARASKNSLVVASIPESDIEIGGEAGSHALEAIEHTFGRMESIWKPVAADEGFEVVRRRLFLPCKDPAARDAVCEAFSSMYRESSADFPVDAKEQAYKERMASCYPIHPEVFDRLYGDWATLDTFQRTRGVLRLMAAVIHELWMGNDASAMIMPGSLPLDVPAVRDELTRYLDESWNGIVDSEIDGRNSIPYQLDRSNARYGHYLAARRVSRTIFLGSAPSVRDQSVRGTEKTHIHLGTVQPGENIAIFNDALSTLHTQLSYLYSDQSRNRFWYDTRPTLRKQVEDRAQQKTNEEADQEISRRLHALRREQPFSGVHVCPNSSLDVPDDMDVRLVVLPPDRGYSASDEDCAAMRCATDILDNRGIAPRVYRNMLVFLAPDQEATNSLRIEVKRYLAWESIKHDSERLNLDAVQNRETENNLRASDETVKLRIDEAYCWLLSPTVDKDDDIRKTLWNASRISGGTETVVHKAGKKLEQTEEIITRWAPITLLMQLDSVLWKNEDDVQVGRLWEYLCTYCYLPRLANRAVLEAAIRDGLPSSEFFGIAAGKIDGRYVNLRLNESAMVVNDSDLLVKVPIAKRQLEAEKETAAAAAGGSDSTNAAGESESSGQSADAEPAAGEQESGGTPTTDSGNESQATKYFYLTTKLDNTRVNRDVNQIMDEVVNHLSNLDGSDVQIKLEVTAEVGSGIDQSTVRTVSENCRTLNVDDFGFDE